jgi:hypothetical protein
VGGGGAEVEGGAVADGEGGGEDEVRKGQEVEVVQQVRGVNLCVCVRERERE